MLAPMEPGPPQVADNHATIDHILIDIHELLRRFDAFEKKFDAEIAEAKRMAAPFTRMRDGARLRGLGKGRQ